MATSRCQVRAKPRGRWHRQLKELLQSAQIAFILRWWEQPRAWEKGRAAAGLWGISRGSLGVTGESGSQTMVVCCQKKKGHVSFGVNLPHSALAGSTLQPAAKRGPSSARLIIARVRSARREIPFKGAEGEAGKKGAAAHSPQPSSAPNRPETHPNEIPINGGNSGCGIRHFWGAHDCPQCPISLALTFPIVPGPSGLGAAT